MNVKLNVVSAGEKTSDCVPSDAPLVGGLPMPSAKAMFFALAENARTIPACSIHSSGELSKVTPAMVDCAAMPIISV